LNEDGSGTTGAGGKPTPLVFIHDAAIDDFVATLLLDSMPQYDLKGIVIVNADCVPLPGIEVAARVNAFMGRPDLPLGLSAARGWNPFPWEYRSDCLRLAQIPSLAPFAANLPTPPPSGDALLERLLDEAAASATPLTVLLTTGFTPLTEVLTRRPELAKAVGKVAWMGGAYRVAGNLDPKTVPPEVANPWAEWNVFWDPYAADDALALLPGIAVFPLDITNKAAITADFKQRLLVQAAAHSFSQFAYEAYSLVADEPFYDMWNVATTVWLDAPELYSAPECSALEVVRWGADQGWMKAAPAGAARPRHDVYLSFADVAKFYDYVVERLARSA
jgi:purine nucleosidase